MRIGGLSAVPAVRDDPGRVETELAAGRLCCPFCGGSLGPWGWARPRRLRAPAGWRWLRPRRTRCRTCRATHVLVSTATLTRRSATIEVIGVALAAKRVGMGIAASPPGSACLPRPSAGGCAGSRSAPSRWEPWPPAGRIASTPMWGGSHPRGSPFDDALEALGVAVGAVVRALWPGRSRWHVVAALTGAMLLTPAPLLLP